MPKADGRSRRFFSIQGRHQAEVDELVLPFVGNWTRGAVVGLIGPEGSETYGYGEMVKGGRTPDQRSLFEIGSLTKTFTGLLLAQGVVEGRFSLDQPVQACLSETDVRVPFWDTAMTLRHLATHTAGFPLMPGKEVSHTFSLDKLYAYLNGYKLRVIPGNRWTYSNLGVGLLGHLLALDAGSNYYSLLKDRVLKPLGMKDTGILLSRDQQSRAIQPHGRNQKPVAPLAWKTDALVGAGALKSTAEDLLRYLAAQTGLWQTPLAQAIALARVPCFAIDDATTMALGWMYNEKEGYYYHEGETDGCSSYAGFDPTRQTGVVLLANTRCRYPQDRQAASKGEPYFSGGVLGWHHYSFKPSGF